MAESFRQQIAATGIQETKILLTSATSDLKSVTSALDKAVQPLSARYSNIAVELELQASKTAAQASRLVQATEQLQTKNSELRQEIKNLEWYWFATGILCLLLIGAFLGAEWEGRQYRHLDDAMSAMQEQFAQFNELLKHPPQPPAPAKKPRGSAR